MVRDGVVPAGTDECCAEAGGAILLTGTGVDEAAAAQISSAHTVWILPATRGVAGRLAAAIVAGVREIGQAEPDPTRGIDDGWQLILPSSPDGRDIAPRLAHTLGVPLIAGAVRIRNDVATVLRTAGRTGDDIVTGPSFVATFVPGVRGVGAADLPGVAPRVIYLPPPDLPPVALLPGGKAPRPPVRTLRILPPDPATADLAEADRIVAGGQGLGSTGEFERLGRVGAALGASLGGTRVASDAGWIPFERQIGTTGAIVHPSLYLAFGISGATQHTTGLGDPEHIISVNTDASCPMMTMADLAIVADATAVVAALEAALAAAPNPALRALKTAPETAEPVRSGAGTPALPH